MSPQIQESHAFEIEALGNAALAGQFFPTKSPLDSTVAAPCSLLDTMEMNLGVSELTYTYASLRRILLDAPPGTYPGSEHIIAGKPLSADKMLAVVMTHREALLQQDPELLGPNDSTSPLVGLINSVESGATSLEYWTNWILCRYDSMDENELVYCISVNHNLKRVTVAFRGTVNVDNWIHNFKAYMKETKNPFFRCGRPMEESAIHIHGGFHDYLFQKQKNGETKFQQIVDNLLDVLKQCPPGYNVYVTGHSLGGALASLFTFFVASVSDNEIPKPVQCISFASPLVGDAKFHRAFRRAEDCGMVRYLRVTNDRDVIPTLPSLSLFRFIPYTHVGVNLRLEAHGQYVVQRRREGGNILRRVGRIWSSGSFKFLLYEVKHAHSTQVYNEHLQFIQGNFHYEDLGALYQDQDAKTGKQLKTAVARLRALAAIRGREASQAAGARGLLRRAISKLLSLFYRYEVGGGITGSQKFARLSAAR